MSTNDARLARDDRGAIMVLGIFMCSILVGALWYLAGIGDAILHRERIQEAADAMAFSSAALHARGMNLIVLVNLIMACVLGVRVALRVGVLVLTICAAIFSAGIVTLPAAVACAAGATALETAVNSTKPAIDGALTGLSATQDVLSKATPGLAQVGARVNVGPKYAPVVNHFGIATKEGPLSSLPVERGSEKKLCGEAGGIFPALIASKMPDGLDTVMETITSMMKELVRLSPGYFCGLNGSSEPNSEKHYDDAAAKRCDREPYAEHERLEEAEKVWLSKCRESRIACESRDRNDPNVFLDKGVQHATPVDSKIAQELMLRRMERDQAKRAVDEYEKHSRSAGFDRDACLRWAKAEMKQSGDEKKKASGKTNSVGFDPSSGTRPMMTKQDMRNGAPIAQVIGIATGDETRLRPDAKRVRTGTVKSKRTPTLADPTAATMPSWAQAELFYDCNGKWGDAVCNADEDAMWHFRWRVRLRRFNEPMSIDQAKVEAGVFAATSPNLDSFSDRLSADAKPVPGKPKANAALRVDLMVALKNQTNRTRGTH